MQNKIKPHFYFALLAILAMCSTAFCQPDAVEVPFYSTAQSPYYLSPTTESSNTVNTEASHATQYGLLPEVLAFSSMERTLNASASLVQAYQGLSRHWLSVIIYSYAIAPYYLSSATPVYILHRKLLL